MCSIKSKLERESILTELSAKQVKALQYDEPDLTKATTACETEM